MDKAIKRISLQFYYLQAAFFCCGLGIPVCKELHRTDHWHKNITYSTRDLKYKLKKKLME
jgi:hypothetical protein